MIDAPTISILIPSFNQGKYIERTLLSILKQKYSGKVEIIVSDGGSTDNTVEILKRYSDRIQWWSEKDSGFVDAVTKAFSRSTGAIIAIQSSDDYYLENALAHSVLCLANNPEVSFVTGGEIAIDIDYNIRYVTTADGMITPRSILFGPHVPQNSTFVRREFIDNVGGLRPQVDTCADGDLWYRISHLVSGIYTSEITSVYQLHPDQRTTSPLRWVDSYRLMVDSCENRVENPIKPFLSPNDKESLFAYLEMVFAGRANPTDALALAQKFARRINTFDARTRKTLIDLLVAAPASDPSSLARLLRCISRWIRRQLTQKSLIEALPGVDNNKRRLFDLLWWRKG